MFRGYLQKGLVERLGFPVGLVIGAVVFGLYHLPMGIPIPMLGMVKGRDRSLLALVIAHFVFWQVAGFA